MVKKKKSLKAFTGCSVHLETVLSLQVDLKDSQNKKGLHCHIYFILRSEYFQLTFSRADS